MLGIEAHSELTSKTLPRSWQIQSYLNPTFLRTFLVRTPLSFWVCARVTVPGRALRRSTRSVALMQSGCPDTLTGTAYVESRPSGSSRSRHRVGV